MIIGGKRVIASTIHKCPHRQCVANRAWPEIQDAHPLLKEGFDSEVFTYISSDTLGSFQMKTESVCTFKSNCVKCKMEKSKAELEVKEKQKKYNTKMYG